MCLAFELIEEVLREYFHCIADVFFVDCVNSFSAFAHNKTNRGILFTKLLFCFDYARRKENFFKFKHSFFEKNLDVSLRAIESLHFCAVQLANGRVCQLAREHEQTAVTFTDDKKRILFTLYFIFNFMATGHKQIYTEKISGYPLIVGVILYERWHLLCKVKSGKRNVLSHKMYYNLMEKEKKNCIVAQAFHGGSCYARAFCTKFPF
jgi:hypothetical protein